MKRKILIYVILLFSVVCFAADFKVIKDTKIYDESFYKVGIIKKDTIVRITNAFIHNGELYAERVDFKYGTVIIYNGIEYVIDLEAIIPAETKDLFDESIIKFNLSKEGKSWVAISDIDILYSGKRKNIYDQYIFYINNFENLKDEFNYHEKWYEKLFIDDIASINNCTLYFYDSYMLSLYVVNIEKIENGYLVCAEIEDYSKDGDPKVYNPEIEKMSEIGSVINIKMLFDGDYMNVYSSNDVLLFSGALMDSEFKKQMENLFRKDTCDLSKVTWPRHADGTCDYEKGKTLVAPSSSATNVNVNKTMVVKENLKLRSAEATSSNVLNIMAAGTKVKIIELGKVETIDGINSNWVKVEIISGKDRDGNIIRSGTTGWCYGGYLE